MGKNKILRLVLGDQLNINHSWFSEVDKHVTYVLMEIQSETNYAHHHIQKVIGFFAAMQAFAAPLKSLKHQVIYLKLNDENNLQCFDKNLDDLICIA
jgi:deoxyribodipyrimidine photolyase-related protein